MLGISLLGAGLQLGQQPKVVIVGDERGRIFLQDKSVYAQAVHRLFVSTPLNGNKVTINAAAITKELRRQYPELAGVSLSLPVFGHQPVVYLQPATPRLILSGQSGQSFVVDRAGRALLSTNRVGRLDDLKAPVVTDQSGLLMKAGETVIDSNSVAFISEVVGQLEAKGLVVSSLTLPQGTSELMVGISGAPYAVKFNIRGDAREGAGAFLAVKRHLDGQHIQPSQYVDVRVSGRAYYK